MKLRHFVLPLLALIAGALAAAQSTYDPEKMWAAREAENARLLGALDSLEVTRFYRLDGVPKRGTTGPAGSFHGTPVLAEGAPGDTGASKAFKSSLRRVLQVSNGAQSACFYPRHGVRLSDGARQFDIQMCFECSRFVVYDADGNPVYTSGFDADEESARWDESFAGAGL